MWLQSTGQAHVHDHVQAHVQAHVSQHSLCQLHVNICHAQSVSCKEAANMLLLLLSSCFFSAYMYEQHTV